MSYRFFVGFGVGHVVEDSIKDAKSRVWVITPWLGPEYADLLIRKSSEGVDVRLITTNDPFNIRAFHKLIKMERSVKSPGWPSWAKALSLIIAVLGLVLSFINALLLILLVLGVILYTMGRTTYSIEYKPTINDLVVTNNGSLHAKVYIIDNTAMVGSANLTRHGMHINAEAVVMIDDEKLIHEMTKQFEEFSQSLIKLRPEQFLANTRNESQRIIR